uniref:Uncharacterized protein n=1 Tax=Opuntia streptacantha TaxID=393608 RepID=A0A7C9F8V6_OPUST
MSDPIVNPTTRIAKLSPGQLLLPAPKGIILNPILCPSTPSNLSGLKLEGTSQILGSFCIAHRFSCNIVPRGTRYPPTTQSSEDSWGTKFGAAGYIRSVSVMMHRRYGRWLRSDSSSNLSLPT